MRSKFLLAAILTALILTGVTLHAQTSTWTIDPAHSSIPICSAAHERQQCPRLD